jgi:anaerobic selenocysteine-containing dehydrogenase
MEPPGEVKPESEIYRLLADRLDLPREEIESEIPAPGDEAVEAWLEARLEPWPELSLAALRRGPILAPGHQEVAFSDRVFPTPSGKIEILSEEARRRWNAEELPGWFEPEESALRGEGDAARYPLQLMTPNTKDRIHSQFNNLEMIRANSTRPALHVSPGDALRRGIRDGDRVRVFNDRGSLEIEARLDYGLRDGCVSVTNGWWIPEGGTVNFLSLGRETDMGHGAAFHDTVVQVERVS